VARTALLTDPLNWLFVCCIYVMGFTRWRWWLVLPATLAYAAFRLPIGYHWWFTLRGPQWWTIPVDSKPDFPKGVEPPQGAVETAVGVASLGGRIINDQGRTQ
jgi:hypothetical protein